MAALSIDKLKSAALNAAAQVFVLDAEALDRPDCFARQVAMRALCDVLGFSSYTAIAHAFNVDARALRMSQRKAVVARGYAKIVTRVKQEIKLQNAAQH